MNVTEQTKSLAQKIYDYFLEHPERHNQNFFVATDESGNDNLTEENLCNSTMCIAGSAVFLTEGFEGIEECRRIGGTNFEDRGAELLGLDFSEAMNLFYCMDNDAARDAVMAIAAGDEEKFWNIMQDADE